MEQNKIEKNWIGLKGIALKELNPTHCIMTEIPLTSKQAVDCLKDWKELEILPEHNQIFKLAGIKFQFKKVENGIILS